jgi:D-xylulose reductase
MIPNPSLVLNKINDITFELYDAPEITDPSDIIVEVKKTGICGSDIHYYPLRAICWLR